jgi:hypothetical protein
MKKTMQVMMAILLLLSAYIVMADPEGGTVTFIDNSTKSVTPATYREDPKGTITTITLNSVQQNTKWKAYIGNVTGTLVLRDSDDYSIYEWSAIEHDTMCKHNKHTVGTVKARAWCFIIR